MNKHYNNYFIKIMSKYHSESFIKQAFTDLKLEDFPIPPDSKVLEVSHPLTCMYLNARSINNKMKLLLNYIDLKRPRIIFITETWASSDIPDGFYAVPGYKLMRADRLDRKGGGVMVFILEGMHSSQISLKSHFDFELVSFVVN